MLFGIASIILDTGVEISFWVIKSSVSGIYNSFYIWKYGHVETTDDKISKLILVEKENQVMLKDTLNRLKIQEMEISRLRKLGKKVDATFETNIKGLEQFTIIDHNDLHL
tara:strand:+ start:59 stop:388 length:330 start_codon:yes stop_codon:yes gene_type:complete